MPSSHSCWNDAPHTQHLHACAMLATSASSIGTGSDGAVPTCAHADGGMTDRASSEPEGAEESKLVAVARRSYTALFKARMDATIAAVLDREWQSFMVEVE